MVAFYRFYLFKCFAGGTASFLGSCLPFLRNNGFYYNYYYYYGKAIVVQAINHVCVYSMFN